MITPLTQRQQDLIVNNVLRAVDNIEQLNKTGYSFLYLANGFIAHYNIHGFKAHYSVHSLTRDILNNKNSNMWRNFSPADRDYAYYMSKREVYERIIAGIEEMVYN